MLPAFVERQALRLLRAAAAGVPVIASSACGVDNVAGVTTIDAGDAYALRQAIESALAPKRLSAKQLLHNFPSAIQLRCVIVSLNIQ